MSDGCKPCLGLGLLLLLLVPLASPTRAQATRDDTASLAGSCMACHGRAGISPGIMPSIAGRPEKDLALILSAFRDGTVEGATVMTRIMKGFDQAEIDALARYYAALPPQRAP